MSLRGIAALAAALVTLTGTAFAVQEHDRRDALVIQLPAARPLLLAASVRSTPVTRSITRSGATALVDPSWLTTTATATGIPEPALRAYAQAQLSDVGGCGVGWTTLAGIGWVESQHGTIGGRSLESDGHSTTPILGPALDGRGAFAAIRSTAQSRTQHGDAGWEHAVGPMQFLPATWATWATDGDRDGLADVQDLDDAAAATARYLCAAGQNLSSGTGWSAAVYSYNHARSYVDAVRAAASQYAARSAA